jgi:hypothetical protein
LKVEFFKRGDRSHSFVARDGTLLPLGKPVELLRAKFGGNEGYVEDPYGTGRHFVRIPPAVKDGEDNYVSLRFTSLKPGASWEAHEQAERAERQRRFRF